MNTTTALENNRLVRTFARLRGEGGKALLPFITAGYPSLEATGALLREFDRIGVPVCELGIPFTDPIADGPVIQASYTDALASGVALDGVLGMVRRFRDAGGKLALLAMVSYSIVYRHGVEHFLDAAAAAGIDGLIVPDLPLGESAAMENLAAERGLALVLLIAPTTPPERRLEIARHSRGFLYFISVAGITGERTKLPPQTIDAVAEMRRHTDTPVCVGFGISDPAAVRSVCQAADGAIVGSAIVRRITEHRSEPPETLAKNVGRFVAELLGSAR